MATKKIVCIGSGSLHFTGVIANLVSREELAGSEIVLYDLVQDKSERMAAMGRRLTEQAGHGLTVRAAGDIADTLDGADFVLTSIGGSGGTAISVYGSYYHRADMHISAKYGLYQVIGDTGGPAGMMMGLRAIPAYVDLCRQMESYCPRAILLNHTNPMAPICRAMRKYSSIHTVGICHGVQNTIQRIAELLDRPPSELDCKWVGTNHYYWFLKVVHRGEDLTEELFAKVTTIPEDEDDVLWRELSAAYGVVVGIPGANHLIEFYPWATRVSSQDDQPEHLADCARRHGFTESDPFPTRDDATDEDRAKWGKMYTDALDGAALPDRSAGRSFGEEPIDDMIVAVAEGRREVFVLNLPNEGVFPNLPLDALVEVEAVADSTGFRGLTVGACPPVLKGMLEKRFAWQELVADAGVNGDRKSALQAMLLDEMALSPARNEALLEELLQASRDRLPQFFS